MKKRRYLYQLKVRTRVMYTLTFVLFFQYLGISQETNGFSQFFTPSDTFNQKRFTTAVSIGSATYAGFAAGLYYAWYKQYPQENFHLFNDWNEWGNMDKFGHLFSSYFQAHLTYTGARWTGLDENNSILTGIICASLFQGTIEIMDGFSTNWGFSLSDMAFNNAGIGAFVLQQKIWKEQRIKFKVSSLPERYSENPILSTSGLSSTNLEIRADDLFGSNYYERFLKDYNAQIVWASVNIHSFLPDNNKFPKWLNIALGYGSENMFGGFTNSWVENGELYVLNDPELERYKQFYIGLDLDLDEIKTDNHFLKGVLSMFNIFKMPSPALEINTRGEIQFHLFR